MHNHRLGVPAILIFIGVSLARASPTCDGHGAQDEISFGTKASQSPSIVIGTSLNKNIDFNIPNLFNVTFLVQCILKGRPTHRIIHIVQAGSLLGRRSCQRLDVNREYLVFLEPFFDGTYRPVDLEEIPYNTHVNTLLAETCGLTRMYPFTESNDTEAFSTNKCPSAVSVDCPIEAARTTNAMPATGTVPTISTTTSSTTSTKTSLDLEALSLLLAQHDYQNLSLAFLQNQNHKSLFSDDDARKNQACQAAPLILTVLIPLVLGIAFHRFL